MNVSICMWYSLILCVAGCVLLLAVLALPGASCERLDELFPASVHLVLLVFCDRSPEILAVLIEVHVHTLSERLKRDLWGERQLKSITRVAVRC